MKFLRIIICFIFILFEVVAYAQTIKNIKLAFHTMVGNKPLAFDSNYITSNGDTFSVTKFKFFVGIKELSCSNHSITGTNYYLIDQSDTLSQIIRIGRCDSVNNIQFIVGVDSIKNVSGVQTGALDPSSGMFWTWNSGYIMAKLEGRSPQSKAPFGKITYHIGGFRGEYNSIKKISLAVTKEMYKTFQPKSLAPSSKLQGKEIIIDINVDLNKWFDGPHPIKISEKPFCMSPSKMAIEIADNYANMFSIKSISIR